MKIKKLIESFSETGAQVVGCWQLLVPNMCWACCLVEPMRYKSIVNHLHLDLYLYLISGTSLWSLRSWGGCWKVENALWGEQICQEVLKKSIYEPNFRSVKGMMYLPPPMDSWSWTSDCSVNFALHAVKKPPDVQDHEWRDFRIFFAWYLATLFLSLYLIEYVLW